MIGIFVLNWRSAQDTIKCVESIYVNVLRKDFRVFIIDNDSKDESVETFQCWIDENQYSNVHLFVNNVNSGYGGGNNFGLDKAFSLYQDIRYVWLVNNDCYLVDDALTPMFDLVSLNSKLIVGSIIVNASNGKIECLGGGKHYPLLGRAKLCYKNDTIENVVNKKRIKKPDYIMGCSFFVNRDFFHEVGYFDEKYFMYSEEIDLQKRASSMDYKLDVSLESVVYHWGSKSSGGRSPLYYFYRNRAAIMFNRKFYGYSFACLSALFLSVLSVIEAKSSAKNLKASIHGVFSALTLSSR